MDWWLPVYRLIYVHILFMLCKLLSRESNISYVICFIASPFPFISDKGPFFCNNRMFVFFRRYITNNLPNNSLKRSLKEALSRTRSADENRNF